MKELKNIPLQENEYRAITTAMKVLKDVYDIESVILFGSKSRGDDDENSDIDLLMVTARPLHWREEKALVERLFDVGMEYDVIFSPLLTSREEWEEGIFREFPVYEDIMRDGALII